MKDRKIDELLEKIFANVNSWLCFAEAKHAANIALIIACIAAIVSYNNMNGILYCTCIVLIVSGICSLIAFFPNLDRWSQIKEEQRKIEDNFIYFNSIKKYAGKRDEYLQRIGQVYFSSENCKFTQYQKDLADEIIINAEIISVKYNLFKWVVRLDVVSFILLIYVFGTAICN